MRAIFRSRTLGERLGIILMLLIPLIIIGVVLFFLLKPNYTEGLNFELTKDGSGYTVVKYDGDDKVVEIPERYMNKPVVAIGENAFRFNTELETVRIPGSVKVIESGAFESCNKLLDITLESGTETIEKGAFKNCKYITYLNLPSTLTCVEPGAFSGCIRVEYITVAEGNSKYHAEGGCLIETESKTLALGGWNCVIPEDGSVTTIGVSAFENNGKLENIVIPKAITKIDDSAFQGCLNLRSVTYKGTSAEWDKIEIADGNHYFEGVMRYFSPENEE